MPCHTGMFNLLVFKDIQTEGLLKTKPLNGFRVRESLKQFVFKEQALSYYGGLLGFGLVLCILVLITRTQDLASAQRSTFSHTPNDAV